MDKLIYIYNKLYFSFAQDTLSSLSDTKEFTATRERFQVVLDKGKQRSLSTKRFIERFASCLTPEVLDALVQESYETVLNVDQVKQLSLVRKVTVADLLACLKSGEDATTLKSYIYTFALLGFLYNKNSAVIDGDDSDDDNEGHNDTEDDVVILIDNAIACLRELQDGKQVDIGAMVSDPIAISLLSSLSKVITPSTKNAIPDPDIGFSGAEVLKNTKIGSLAKEISEEIDLSSLKIEKPEDLLNPQSLLGGGGNNVLTDIISKVGSKIHQKIDKGELKHEELMNEAIGMLGMLGKGGNPAMGSFLNNPLFQDVMKNMGGMASAANAFKNSDKAKSANVRDRLRKKLDERDKIL